MSSKGPARYASPGETIATPGETIATTGETIATPGETIATPGETIATPLAEWGGTLYQLLSLDEIYIVVCRFAECGAAVGLGLTCRALLDALRRMPTQAYASAAPKFLGKRGSEYLIARWVRFGVSEGEVEAALQGAVQCRNITTVCWLVSTGGIPGAFSVPSLESAGGALAALVKQEITCEEMAKLVGACPVSAVREAFVAACAVGKLGIAQIAHRRALAACPATALCDQRALLKAGIEATERRSCYKHIVNWANGLLRVLDRRRQQ
jgi:hypothetical protein